MKRQADRQVQEEDIKASRQRQFQEEDEKET
jgi:hypothetical protein